MTESTSHEAQLADAFQKIADLVRIPEVSKLLEQAVFDAIAENADQIRASIGQSDEAAGLIRLLAARSGDNREDVLLKALTLYGLAIDAIEKGNHLAILTPEDEILREITGFEPVETAGR